MTLSPTPDRRRVVAELGRPETPQETADRRAAARRERRAHQTAFNLVAALVASLAIVAFLVVVVVRPDQQSFVKPVDWRAVADQAQQVSRVHLVVPALSDRWSSNRAEYDDSASDGVDTWEVGFITPRRGYIALSQGVGAGDSWAADLLDKKRATGDTTIAGRDWTVYDHRDDEDPGNLAYALVTDADGSRIVLSGTAATAEFRQLAQAVDRDLAASAGGAS